MGNAIIKFSSVTYAIRAQKVLEQHGIRTYMKKITNTKASRGCGYGLEVAVADLQTVARILAMADIRVVEVIR